MTDMMSKIAELKNGTFHKFSIKSDVPTLARYKADVKITKYSSFVGRTGVDYTAVKATPEVKGMGAEHTNIIKNKVLNFTNTGSTCLRIYPKTDSKREISYTVTVGSKTRKVSDLKEISEFVRPSYIKSHMSNGTVPYITVKVDNILAID